MSKKENCGDCLFSHFKEINDNLIAGYKLGREIKKNLKEVTRNKELPPHVKKEAEILLKINRDFIRKKLN